VLRPDGLPSPDPRADLRALRLRAADGRVCVAYETAGEVAGPMEFTFELRDSAETARFSQRFIATLREDGGVLVWGGGPALSVPVEIGMGGHSFTLVLDGRSFEKGQAISSAGSDDPPLDRFGFTASVRTSLGGGRRVRDMLGPLVTPQSYRYPDGRRCSIEQACNPPRSVPLSPQARRIKPALTRTCARLGGRVERSPRSEIGLACIVRYSGVPYQVLLNLNTGGINRREARFQRQECLRQQKDMREIGRAIADSQQTPIRVDLYIWHPRTGVCEMRLKGQLVRPR
jgi:hypothetical protein